MLQVNNLSIQFNGNYLFDNVSFIIRPTDKIGLIGRNGTGKSTLFKIIAGLQEPEKGTVSKPNDYRIGYLPQEMDIHSSMSVFDETKSALTEIQELEKLVDNLTIEIAEYSNHQSVEYLKKIEKLSAANERLKILGAFSIDAEIEKVLLGLGFSQNDLQRPLSSFSGGWQMRVELAKILLTKPNCILLDEPTNHLDIDSVQWLEEFLSGYYGAIVIISHDKSFLDNITNRTFELSRGKLIDLDLKFSDFLEARKKQREEQIAAAKAQQKQIAETERFIERFRSKATLASRVQSKIKSLEKMEVIEIEEEDNATLDIRFPEPPRSSRLIVEAKNLTKKYGEKIVLENVNFVLERGEKVAFVGRNGEGKTTFSKILANTESYEGELIFGNNLCVGYYAQHRSMMLDENATVFEIIDSAATGDMRTKVRSLLGAFLFSGDSVYKKVKVLSGGEKSRLALAKLLLEPINFLILDEPTNHLDMLAKDILKSALVNYSGSLIIVSHDRDFLKDLTQKTYHFANKSIEEYLGSIDDYLLKIKVDNLKEIERKTILTQNSTNIQTQTQLDRIRKKELQRQENKLKKLIADCEHQISLLEEQISEIEQLFSDPDFFSNKELSIEKRNQYNNFREQLNQKYAEWEELESKLMNL
ncbi:MAG: ABC-F family ATP-binding cassette domain-containing protein [Bacteroidota bacterium]